MAWTKGEIDQIKEIVTGQLVARGEPLISFRHWLVGQAMQAMRPAFTLPRDEQIEREEIRNCAKRAVWLADAVISELRK